MTREFTKYADSKVKVLLDRIAAKATEPKDYRAAMKSLGQELAERINNDLDPTARVLLICTNEDADFLASGVLDELTLKGHECVNIACFWNARMKFDEDAEAAPILRSYIEPTTQVDAFVVVKSIISGGCVVRTNISELVYDFTPSRIIIASPVMYIGAKEGLEEDFEPEVVDKFEYFYFAEDQAKDDKGNVNPGIGGSVYERLGIGDSKSKNGYNPELVKARREMSFSAHQ